MVGRIVSPFESVLVSHCHSFTLSRTETHSSFSCVLSWFSELLRRFKDRTYTASIRLTESELASSDQVMKMVREEVTNDNYSTAKSGG